MSMLFLAIIPCQLVLCMTQIKGGEWEGYSFLEASGLEEGVGRSVALGPPVAGAGATVFCRWVDTAASSTTPVYGLFELPNLNPIWEVTPNQPLTSALAACPVRDFDGDGVDDLLVGNEAMGVVQVFSGASGVILHSVSGSAGSGFGQEVLQLADCDFDGVNDWAILASRELPPNGSVAGRIYIYSGVTGAPVRVLDPGDSQKGIGTTLADAGDWDGDGVGDIALFDIVGDWQYGRGLLIRSGLDGQILRDWATSSFANAILPITDIDGDGLPEFATGNKYETSSSGVSNSGAVHLYLSCEDTHSWKSEGNRDNEVFGVQLSVVQDLDFDGIPDLLAASHIAGVNGQAQVGYVKVLSTAGGERIRRITGIQEDERFGEGMIGFHHLGERFICVGSPGWIPANDPLAEGKMQVLRFNEWATADKSAISASAGGTVWFNVDFPDGAAGNLCFPLVSRVGLGTTPVLGVDVSLANGPLMRKGLATGYPFLSQRVALLGFNGDWTIQFTLPPISAISQTQELFVVFFQTPLPVLHGEGNVSYPIRLLIQP
jgi:hypothetical protein